MNNQKGLTLLEVLLALTVLTIIGGVIWNVFIQGVKFSGSIQTNTLMQQEANTILTAIRDVNKNTRGKSNDYKITYDDTPGSSYIRIEGTEIFEFKHPSFIYSIFDLNDVEYDENIAVCPNFFPKLGEDHGDCSGKIHGDFPIKLVIESVEDPNLSYEIQAYISKLR